MSVKTTETAAPTLASTFGVKPPKRPYLVVKAELQEARSLFQTMVGEHEKHRARATTSKARVEARSRARQTAIRGGVITPDDDFTAEFAIPALVPVPQVFQEKFHRQHYVIAQLEEEEASYSAIEKGGAFAEAGLDV
jgi:hypothetical protein